VVELEERVDRLGTERKELLADWEAMYDKFLRLLRRFNQRERRAAEAPEQPAAADDGLDPISAQIIARRNRALRNVPGPRVQG
jgi:hypothetical protein